MVAASDKFIQEADPRVIHLLERYAIDVATITPYLDAPTFEAGARALIKENVSLWTDWVPVRSRSNLLKP